MPGKKTKCLNGHIRVEDGISVEWIHCEKAEHSSRPLITHLREAAVITKKFSGAFF